MVKRLMTPEDVAELLQLHHLTVLKFIREKKLPAVQIGRVYRVREEDLNAFLDAQATT